jgi:hypothetical protein
MVIDSSTSDLIRLSYMPYNTGTWGIKQKARSKRRLEYFKSYRQAHGPPKKVFRLGYFGELLAQGKMNGSKLVNQTSHDLEWNGQRVEVKTSATDENGYYRFDIRIQKRDGNTDFFFILILDGMTKDLRHAYLIPNKAINAKVCLNIKPGTSKYERYRICLK